MTEEQSVLVIDDEKINLKIISDMLNDEVVVMLAKSGEQGIRKAMEYKPDLILLDVVMPEMDGFETMSLLRHDVRTSAIPVIFITALNDSSHEEKALLMGASDYIQKPLHTNIVQARVRLHLQLVKQRKMLEKLANIDPLTSLANRRKYQNVIEQEWQNAIANQASLSLLVIDIDNFKQYNDCYGHATGDKVLQQVATVLAKQVLDKGLVARYGGEEFVILLPSHSQEESIEVARRCMQGVGSLNLAYTHQNCSGKVTVSVGGATKSPSPHCRSEDFFNAADGMLGLAKKSGKNKILWHSPSNLHAVVE
ncbi:diguanylate cyclase [Marinomonas rhizomae]|uniref:diguanylate cyclase n=1 Tax=Marinomonas rhizomae TaxID=491948 RepID=A0A366JH43_9GAMM|nr:diguanylate cyclase [Marinomonas rhizomae]RBP85800.1 response regulator receiver modulated diguanylate cyclase [Marinomonas rhizomae]RNF75583.1 diguanylate cyclase [Marinomonas rhizomae]